MFRFFAITLIIVSVWVIAGLVAFYRDFYPAIRPRRLWWKELRSRWFDSLCGMIVWSMIGPFALRRPELKQAGHILSRQ